MDPALEALLKTQPALWRGNEQYQQQPIISTGYHELDKVLPGGGWQTGTLTEFLIEHPGVGEFSLLLPVLKSITNPAPSASPNQQSNGQQSNDQHSNDQQFNNKSSPKVSYGQWSALVNPPFIPYAPAFANAGVDLDRVLIVDTDNDNDTLWATEQLLRAGIFTIVICWLGKTDARRQRRLQLAAETGSSLAIAYRSAAAAKDASPAALRILISRQSSTHKHNGQKNGLSLDILKSRGLGRSTLVIHPHDFDAPQGVEWPGFDNPATDPARS